MALTAHGADAAFTSGLLAGTRILHLHTAGVPTATNLVTGGAYAGITLRSNDFATSTVSGRRRAANTGILSFPTPTSDWTRQHSVGLWDGAPASGNLLWYWAAAGSGIKRGTAAHYVVGAFRIDINLTVTVGSASGAWVTADAADRLFSSGLVSGAIQASLHTTTGAPRSSNQITGSGYVPVSIPSGAWRQTTPQAGVRRLSNRATINFPTPGGAWTRAVWLALWNGAPTSDGSNLLMRADIADFTAARDGAVQFLPGDLSIDAEVT